MPKVATQTRDWCSWYWWRSRELIRSGTQQLRHLLHRKVVRDVHFINSAWMQARIAQKLHLSASATAQGITHTQITTDREAYEAVLQDVLLLVTHKELTLEQLTEQILDAQLGLRHEEQRAIDQYWMAHFMDVLHRDRHSYRQWGPVTVTEEPKP
jgi:hypothetical protein